MNTQRRWHAPWVFSLLIWPLGMIYGFNFTALPYLLAKAGIPVDRIASVSAIASLPGVIGPGTLEVAPLPSPAGVPAGKRQLRSLLSPPEIAGTRLSSGYRGFAFLNPVYWLLCKPNLGAECDG